MATILMGHTLVVNLRASALNVFFHNIFLSISQKHSISHAEWCNQDSILIFSRFLAILHFALNDIN